MGGADAMSGLVGEALAAKWRARIERQRRSRSTVGEFCAAEGVSTASFYQWRRRLEQAAGVSVRTDRPAPHFIELSAPSRAGASPVRITLPSGAVVALPADASAELATIVLRAVMSATPEAGPC
jgi:hypothetical protein